MKIQKIPINEQITANEMLLIDEKGKSLGKVSYDQAMLLAYDKDLDLILVSPNGKPAVTKLMDYAKEQYKQEKSKRKQRAKQKTLELKAMKLGLKIEQHDLETKARQVKKFLEKGHKVKVILMLRGREMLFQDKVKNLFDKILKMSNGEYEQSIKKERNIFKAILRLKK